MGCEYHRIGVNASGVYNAQLPETARTYFGVGVGYTISMVGVREWSAILVDSSGHPAIDIDYQLVPGGSFTEYQANMVNGTRYTHLTLDNISYNTTNTTFLPIHALRFDPDSLANSGTIHVFLFRD